MSPASAALRLGDEAGQATGQSDVEISFREPRLDALLPHGCILEEKDRLLATIVSVWRGDTPRRGARDGKDA